MAEPRTRPRTETVRRRVRQKTTPAFATFEALGGSGDEEGCFSYTEDLQKSSPHLIGFARAEVRTVRDGDHDWLTTHWKSPSQRRRADMGDPTAVDADMVELIATTAERVQFNSEGQTSRIRPPEAEPAFASNADNLSVEAIINLEDIDIDALGNNQKRHSGP